MAKTVSNKSKKQILSFSCSPELVERIENVCKHQGCTKSWLITKTLEEYLMEMEEELEDLKIAEERWEKYEAGEDKLIPAEEVYKRLGI